MLKFLGALTDRILQSGEVTSGEALRMLEVKEQRDIVSLISFANRIRAEFKGSTIDLCAIINAKSGSCSEDCIFCSQSAHYHTHIDRYPLVKKEGILEKAKEAYHMGANRFGIVVSGRRIASPGELGTLYSTIEDMSSNVAIGRCASLGTLTREAARELKKAGLQSYHHNLETAESFFPRVCTTHSYRERVETVQIAKEEGFRVCCGGIFGLGETPKQRIEFAFTLRELEVDSIPLNFLNPISGTPVENAPPIPPMEILKIIAIFRFIHPRRDIRVCGGRQRNLRGVQPLMYLAGANATMIGDYLTTPGSDPKEDLQLIEDLMLSPQRSRGLSE
ncbi:MAG: biotin synthase BioB [Pseudomonadota bacterium]